MEDGFSNATVVVPNKLFWSVLRTPETMRTNPIAVRSICFNIDEELLYEPFFADFGPLHLGHTYRFCELLNRLLVTGEERGIPVYYCCSAIPQLKTNAAVLMGAYMVIYMGKTAEEAIGVVMQQRPFMPFRDASCGAPTFHLHVQDALRGLYRAKQCGFVDWHLGARSKFDILEFEYYESVENADLNWIIPGKLLGFGGPAAKKTEFYGYRTLVPEDYLDYFKNRGVTSVVRLNKKVYDRRKFTQSGFRHHEMYFPDGTCPTEPILRKFLEVAESEPGALAIHCKAGLGRTGVLICCFMMKHYGFTAEEALGYIRLCRPGSVIGPQQNFLKDMQEWCYREGDKFRARGGKFQMAPIYPVRIPGLPAGLQQVGVEPSWPSFVPRPPPPPQEGQEQPPAAQASIGDQMAYQRKMKAGLFLSGSAAPGQSLAGGAAGGSYSLSGAGGAGGPTRSDSSAGPASSRYAGVGQQGEVDLDQFIADRDVDEVDDDGRRTSPMKPLRSGTKPSSRGGGISPHMPQPDTAAQAVGHHDVRASAPAVGSGLMAARGRRESGDKAGEGPGITMRSMPAFSAPRAPAPPASPSNAAFKRRTMAATLHTDTVGNAVVRPRLAPDVPRLHQTARGEGPGGGGAAPGQGGSLSPPSWSRQGSRQGSMGTGVGGGATDRRGLSVAITNRSASAPRGGIGGTKPGPMGGFIGSSPMTPRAAAGPPSPSMGRPGSYTPQAARPLAGSAQGRRNPSPSGQGPAQGSPGGQPPVRSAFVSEASGPGSPPPSTSTSGFGSPISMGALGGVMSPTGAAAGRSLSPGRGGAARIVTSTGQPRKVPAALLEAMQREGAVAGVGSIGSPSQGSPGRPGSAVKEGLARGMMHQGGAAAGPASPPSPPSRSPRPPSNGRGSANPRPGPKPEISVR